MRTCKDLFRALDEQRARISRDLHDLTAQQIALIKLRLDRMNKNLGREFERAQLELAIREVDLLAESLQAAVSGLRSPALETGGLAGAIRELVENWSCCYGKAASFDVHGQPETIGSSIALAVYHVAQEALTNIAKHASTASRVSVMLQCTAKWVVLSVEDDGAGFETAEQTESNEHWGLIGLRERVALVGGALEIVSKQESGTTVLARIPWKAEHHEQ